MKATRLLLASIAVVGLLTGCVSAEQRAAQEAQQRAARDRQAAAQQASQQAAAERTRRVSENWTKLKEGLSLDEVDALIGPMNLNPQLRSLILGGSQLSLLFPANAASGQRSNSMRVEFDLYALEFDAFGLKKWTRK